MTDTLIAHLVSHCIYLDISKQTSHSALLFFATIDYANEDTSPKIKVFARHLVPVDKVSSIKKMPFFLYLQVSP